MKKIFLRTREFALTGRHMKLIKSWQAVGEKEYKDLQKLAEQNNMSPEKLLNLKNASKGKPVKTKYDQLADKSKSETPAEKPKSK